jgi:hypothetical protein
VLFHKSCQEVIGAGVVIALGTGFEIDPQMADERLMIG